MSSNQTTQQRRRARAADTEEGFDTLANILTNTFYHTVKEVESYNRSVAAVKNQDPWLPEQQGCHWLGAYKISGKNNYVGETMHRIDTLYGNGEGNGSDDQSGMTPHELEWHRLNRLVVMNEFGHSISLDALNELLNWWNKKCANPESFATVCERSGLIMLLRQCQFETYGRRKHRNNATQFASREKDITRLIELFVRADVFPANRGIKREMTNRFFWDYVSGKKGVGSETDKDKEKVALGGADKELFSVLCSTDGERRDDDSFEMDIEEDDDENISIVSSCVGGMSENGTVEVEDTDGPGDGKDEVEEDWETLNDDDRTTKISETLKKLCGNVKKKRMHANILKDVLGADGLHAIKGLGKKHTKKLRREKRKIESIYVAVKHFDEKMKKRRIMLHDNLKKSKDNTYSKPKYCWRDKYNAMVKEKREEAAEE